ncbi:MULTISPECIES: hypothetical protein [Corallococcus]|uniref:hypothetical protein n=1 Tax=Corallococcus TaxID=83461 RepID=UPI00117DA595|nr:MULTISPECIES: hypothetical protein [Corallococcus]NBD09862.1 hypothetical protein [Corallococcus silvisoli]TSC23919.1 hypothetical protein FOF48_27310 [Corallococcus sp. Z5C101001]
MKKRSLLSGGVLALVLGVCLTASTARADSNSCNTDCATKNGDTLQACISACPSPGDPGSAKADSNRSCSVRCTQKFQAQFNQCKSRCPKAEGDTGPKKAKSVKAARSHH